MACKQMIRERKGNRLWNTLLAEMFMYNTVRFRWGLGHVSVRLVDKYEMERKPFYRYANPFTYYVELNGQYVDLEGRNAIMFLGNGYDQALRRMSHVKSFL